MNYFCPNCGARLFHGDNYRCLKCDMLWSKETLESIKQGLVDAINGKTEEYKEEK